MINLPRLLKVTAAWISIVYIICYAGVAMFPISRPMFMRYAMHYNVNFGSSITTLNTFIAGLVVWNVIAFLAVGLFGILYNNIKK